MKFTYIIPIVALLCILSQTKVIDIQRVDSGPIVFHKDMVYLKHIKNPEDVDSISYTNTNQNGKSLRSEDLRQLKIFSRFTKVVTLTLNFSYNPLVDDLDGLRDAFEGLTNLDTLNLQFSYCGLIDIKAIDYAFLDLTNLKEFSLNLRNNSISFVEDLEEIFKNSLLLTEIYLDFSQNSIDDDLNGLQRIFNGKQAEDLYRFEIDFSENQIEDIEQLSTFLNTSKNVEYVSINLSNNKFESLHPLEETFSGLDSLQEVQLNIKNTKVKNYSPLNKLNLPQQTTFQIETDKCDQSVDLNHYTLVVGKNGGCQITSRDFQFEYELY